MYIFINSFEIVEKLKQNRKCNLQKWKNSRSHPLVRKDLKLQFNASDITYTISVLIT